MARKATKARLAGHWLVTPKIGESRRFQTTKAMVEFIRRKPGCLVSWVNPH